MRCEAAIAVRWFKVWKTSELPAKGTFLRSFCVVQKEPKSTPEVCEPLDSGDDSKLCRKRFCKAFRRHEPNPVFRTKRRRKGFESVRKDSCCADARPLFFEKELFYCKLTVSCRRWYLQLLVSFGAVGSWSFAVFVKSFSLSDSFAWTEKAALFRKSKAIFCTNLSLLLSKATLFHPPPPIRTTLNLLSTKEYSCSFAVRSNFVL